MVSPVDPSRTGQQDKVGPGNVRQLLGLERVTEAMLILPTRLQSLLWYAEILGKNPREIAPLFSSDEQTVSQELDRARKCLRDAFEEKD